MQIVDIQISIQRLHSGCLLDTLLYSKTMLFIFLDNYSNDLGDQRGTFMYLPNRPCKSAKTLKSLNESDIAFFVCRIFLLS